MDLIGLGAALFSGGLIGTAATIFFNRKKISAETRRSIAEARKTDDEYYQSRIAFLKKEIEDQQEKIEGYKKKHPDNGHEFDEWGQSHEKMGHKILTLEKENMELKSQLRFYQKMHRSMYE